jgi:site-specific DNA recombinase
MVWTTILWITQACPESEGSFMMEKRCAVYTRKSHEEGLDQEYNSLHAQRDSCEAYIKSQAHEGWKLVRKRYDDGGFSGGTLKRPALEMLMQDIHGGKVDIIVVYKIDRLTRSLMDFSKIMDVLDAAEASFAAVTQHFNTTTSMGRLTLNVLLSFAQFEREVTGERIRDKIGASRRKGMWMGGARPLGYDNVDKKLVVNEKESNIVRLIFMLYLELGKAADVVEELDRRDIRNKEWIGPEGKRKGGKPFRPQGICTILQNPLYLGKMRFKDEVYEGEHKAIITTEIWEAAQAQLGSQRVKRSDAKRKMLPSLLKGIIYDASDRPMTCTHSSKKGNKKYPYYVSRSILGKRKASDDGDAMRIPARAIESLVRDRVETVCKTKSADHELVKKVVKKITIFKNMVEIELNHGESGVDLKCAESRGDEIVIYKSHAVLRIRAFLQTRDNQMTFLTPSGYDASRVGKPDQVLVKNIVLAWKWREMLDNLKYYSIPELCRGEHQSEGYVRRLLPLSFLAPDVIESILDGKQPPSLDLKHCITTELPHSWDAQRKLLGYVA